MDVKVSDLGEMSVRSSQRIYDSDRKLYSDLMSCKTVADIYRIIMNFGNAEDTDIES